MIYLLTAIGLTPGVRRFRIGDVQVLPTLHVDTYWFPTHSSYPLLTVSSQVLKAVNVNIVVFWIRSRAVLWMSPNVSKDLLQARNLIFWSLRQHYTPKRSYS